MRTLTVKPPRLPPVAAAAPDSGAVEFGPLGWAWSSVIGIIDPPVEGYDNGTAFEGELLVATCPGAVAWRSEPPGRVDGLHGAGVARMTSDDFDVYAISASGAELGPIFFVALAEILGA